MDFRLFGHLVSAVERRELIGLLFPDLFRQCLDVSRALLVLPQFQNVSSVIESDKYESVQNGIFKLISKMRFYFYHHSSAGPMRDKNEVVQNKTFLS